MSGVPSVVMSSRRAVCPLASPRFLDMRLEADFYTAYENSKITTHSHPEAFPSSLRQLRKTTTKVHEGSDALLKVTIVMSSG
jgi:hypothetical protein